MLNGYAVVTAFLVDEAYNLQLCKDIHAGGLAKEMRVGYWLRHT
jgi:hypothetical protein